MGLELSLKFQEKVEPSVGGRPSRVYYLTKRETMILVSGYSVVLRARIVDRWMELERAVLKFEGSYFGVSGPKFGGVYIAAKGGEFERFLLLQRSTGKNAFTPAIRKTCGSGP